MLAERHPIMDPCVVIRWCQLQYVATFSISEMLTNGEAFPKFHVSY